jgi:predicted dehydrogenase
MAKVAVIGCGYWGKNLVRNFAELGALAGVVDGRPDVCAAMASQYNVPAYSLEAALANPEIDGVVIATPAETHCEVALAAFAAGKHVYVEKPIAMSLDEGRAMQEAGKKAGKRLMVGHLLRYHPAFEALLETVKAGHLGKLRYAYSNRLSLGKFRVEENVLWSFAPHDVSMLLALFDEKPTSVTIGGSAWVTPNIEDENRVDIGFASGARAHVFTSWLHPFKEQKLVVIGEKAMAVFEDSAAGADKLRLYKHGIDYSGREPAPTKADAEPIPYGNGEPLRQECAHFLSCIDGDLEPRTGADEALAVLAVLTGDVSSL